MESYKSLKSLENFRQYFKDIPEYPAVRLDNEAFPTTFNPSAGETHLYRIFKNSGEFRDEKIFKVCQPCLRVVDIDNSATSPFHKSFFEMLAVFFAVPENKKENFLQLKNKIASSAINFLIKELGLEADRLLFTIFDGAEIFGEKIEGDKDIESILKDFGVKNIKKVYGTDNLIFHEPQNFDDKPIYDINSYVGPRVEVFYKLDGAFNEKFNVDDPGVVEISTFGFENLWIQPNSQKQTFRLIPAKYQIGFIAFGLERIEMVLQGINSIFNLSHFREIKDDITLLAQNQDKVGNEILINRITDFLSGALFICSEGFLPGKEGKPYVLRKIIRQCILSSLLLKFDKEKILEIFSDVISSLHNFYSPRYPYLDVDKTIVVIKEESALYVNTIEKSMRKFEKLIEEKGLDNIKSEDVKYLSNTFGLPIELVKERLKNLKLF